MARNGKKTPSTPTFGDVEVIVEAAYMRLGELSLNNSQREGATMVIRFFGSGTAATWRVRISSAQTKAHKTLQQDFAGVPSMGELREEGKRAGGAGRIADAQRRMEINSGIRTGLQALKYARARVASNAVTREVTALALHHGVRLEDGRVPHDKLARLGLNVPLKSEPQRRSAFMASARFGLRLAQAMKPIEQPKPTKKPTDRERRNAACLEKSR